MMWAQAINALLGVWMMAAPDLLGYGEPARTNDQIIGPVAASFAIIAIWEATRPVRWANLVFGLWFLIVPWVFDYPGVAAWNSTVVGLLLMSLASVRGKVEQRFGGGWSSLWKRDPFGP